MRIKQITVKGLFGMFDHIIPLNQEERITVIYGINGIGKTMIFKILDSFFNREFEKLMEYPFDNFTIEFLEGQTIEIIKPKRSESPDILFLYQKDNISPVEEIKSMAGFVPSYIKKLKEKISEIARLNLYFIQTQRLITFGQADKYNKVNKTDTIQKYSDELAASIREKHTEYAKKSEELEISLGKRLMGKEEKHYFGQEELKRENRLLEEKRKDLESVGLFSNGTDTVGSIPDSIGEIERAVLSVNIQDMKTKLTIFDEMYEKLKLFTSILNEKRFFYKKISIHPERGFVFTNDDGKNLKASELSSGEQHEVVLLYELLFKIPENSLVLIDEPEISLHISWQMEFLYDLENIVRLRAFDVLLATHSPAIINGNWNLTVELYKEKEDHE